MMICLALVGGAAGVASAQTLDCGNAGYDDGIADGAWFFGGGFAGDPDHMYAVFFALDDFGYEPGRVEITGFCAGNQIDVGFNAAWPNEVFIYPDDNGRPDDGVVLGQGTIHTGTGLGASIVMLDEPVILHGDFWLVVRGFAPFERSDFNMEADIAPDSGHSYVSETGISGLAPIQPEDGGDRILRAYLQPVERSYLTAGMAHASGANDSQWRSKMAVLNTAGRDVEVTLSYAHGSGTDTETVTLPAGGMMAWDDVAVDLFGTPGESSGSIKVDADGPVLVTARTFNIGDAGTFGQFLPGVPAGDSMTSGQTGLLSQLSNNSAFRTNVGFINLGEQQVQVRVTVYDGSGLMLGTRNIAVGPGNWKQQNDIFSAVGAGTVDNGYATVEVMTDGGTVWGYASVVDNATGDPTTVPVAIQ
jgi:hypothetical protein